MYRSITAVAASERFHLPATAAECVASLTTGLGPALDPLMLIPLYIFPPTRTVLISSAKTTIETNIDRTRLISLLPYVVGTFHEKSLALRLIAVETLFAYVPMFKS